MTRTHAAAKLLEHGPLKHREFLEITGWSEGTAHAVMRNLVRRKVATFTCARGDKRRTYFLRSGA